jgi:hypothetical protein
MPNHVLSEIIFRHVNASERRTILTMVRDGKGEINFNILVPMPLNIWMGSVGQNHEKKFKRTALDWCRENWGTKWNAYGFDQGYTSIVETDDSLTLTFQTAWSPPYPWIAALFNFTKLSFEHNYVDEGGSTVYTGKFDYSALDGDDWRKEAWAESQSDVETEKRMKRLMWGEEAETEETES